MGRAMGKKDTRPQSFQEIILRLQAYWAEQGCAVLQPYDMEVGAGTFHPATTLRALGSQPWAAAYVQPSRRPTDGRYGENPNRLQHYYQYQVLIKPSPPNLQDLYLGSLAAIGIDMELHDIRFVEDDWESPTLGAWGLGWEVWCDGMEVSQFTYFQQVGGHDCKPVSGELTYGLERLAMYVLGVDHVMDMPFNAPDAPIPLSYGDVFKQTEEEYARWNFDVANTDVLLRHFEEAEQECELILDQEHEDTKTGKRIIMAHPAYDQCIKASHIFNLLDARGVISVTERQAYIGRVRALVGAFIVVTALVAGIAIYWLQLYAFYEEASVDDQIRLTNVVTGAPELVLYDKFEGIDASSSPLRFRGCFETTMSLAMLTETFETYEDATPLTAPGWFDCFDATQVGEALKTGEAIAFLGERDIHDGVDRVVAIFPDGRAFVWHQLNEKFQE